MDYVLTAEGNVEDYVMKTATDHANTVNGDIVNFETHNLGSNDDGNDEQENDGGK